MSKPWKPGRQTVELQPRPSRIRRDPVRLASDSAPRRTAARTPEQEMWGGVTGVLLFAGAIVALVVGVSAATLFSVDPNAAARAARFDQCYAAAGGNCVADAGTIHVANQKFRIAGMAAPAINDAKCDAERARGISAAVRLVALLNSGPVRVGRAVRDPSGAEVRKVTVDGEDVAKTMIAAGLALDPEDAADGWCKPDSASDGAS